jgi:tetratricopeptide (TPR) repeat protein
MHRPALLVLAVALAPACGGQKPLTATEIDHRAETLTVRGRWDEARALIDRGLSEARARGDRADEARLLLRRGRTLTDQTRHRGGDRAPAQADLTAARQAAERAGDPELIADSIDGLGMHRYVHWFSSQDPADLTGSDQLFRQALAIREPRGDSGGLAESHFHIGLVHQMRGEGDAAQKQFEISLAIAERIRDELRMSYALRHLGYMAEARRDWATAEDCYRRSLELREKVGFGAGVAAAMVTLAEIRYARHGDAEQALGLLARAHERAAEVSSAAYVAISSAAIGRIRRDQGQYDEALRQLAAAIAAMDEIHSDEDVPESYEQMGLIHLLRDQPVAAVTDAERGIARRSTPRLQSLLALARARAGQSVTPPSPDPKDPVVAARLALAARSPAAALDAAVTGDDPDTLLLAAQAVGPEAFDRAKAAAASMSRAQELRFERAQASFIRR